MEMLAFLLAASITLCHLLQVLTTCLWWLGLLDQGGPMSSIPYLHNNPLLRGAMCSVFLRGTIPTGLWYIHSTFGVRKYGVIRKRGPLDRHGQECLAANAAGLQATMQSSKRAECGYWFLLNWLTGLCGGSWLLLPTLKNVGSSVHAVSGY